MCIASAVLFSMCIKTKRNGRAIPNRDFWGALPGYVKDGFVFTGETSVNVVNRMRGQSGGNSSNKDYRPASPDTESYQGAPNDP